MIRGSSGILFLLLGIIIIGAFFLVGGISSLPLTPNNTTETVEPILETQGAGRGNDGLQLQTLKFKSCAKIANVDLLLDRSGSFGYLTTLNIPKIARLREAVKALAANLNDQSIFGFQSFSSLNNGNDLKNDVPISLVKDIKQIISSKLDALRANGGTPTADALNFSLSLLKEAVAKYPDRKFNFIFVTDGAPCPGFGCTGRAGKDQDPRTYTPNPADEIKKLGINIYTVGVYGKDPNTGILESTNPRFTELLQGIATTPANYFEARTGEETPQILAQISNKICKEPGGTVATP